MSIPAMVNHVTQLAEFAFSIPQDSKVYVKYSNCRISSEDGQFVQHNGSPGILGKTTHPDGSPKVIPALKLGDITIEVRDHGKFKTKTSLTPDEFRTQWNEYFPQYIVFEWGILIKDGSVGVSMGRGAMC
jgi:hypothetical protein